MDFFNIEKIENKKVIPQFEVIVETNKTLPAQRTPEWFKRRSNMITASDWGSVFGVSKFKSKKQLYLDKAGYPKPYTTTVHTRWGTKYEDAACMVYEHRTGIKIHEFGCLPHPKHSFLGASPDGISENGIMLEIKCPYQRKISCSIPQMYYIQMQGQLEVCDLDRCDYIECELTELPSSDKETYLAAPMEKGAVITYKNEEDSFVYVHNPKVHIAPEEAYSWFAEFITKNRKANFPQLHFWILNKVYCTTVRRDREWFNKKALPALTEIWDKVIYYRKNKYTENQVRRDLKMTVNKKSKMNVDDIKYQKKMEKKAMNAKWDELSYNEINTYEKVLKNKKGSINAFSVDFETHCREDDFKDNFIDYDDY